MKYRNPNSNLMNCQMAIYQIGFGTLEIYGIAIHKILNWIYSSGKYSSPFDYDYLKYHVTTDIQASQVVANIRPGSKNEEPAYYLVKDYLNMFGARGKNRENEKILINKVEWWLNKNKVQTK